MILSPTRELASQTEKLINAVGEFSKIIAHCCIGGTSISAPLSLALLAMEVEKKRGWRNGASSMSALLARVLAALEVKTREDREQGKPA